MNSLLTWRRGLLCSTLAGDGVIAYPTEGVWGLGCSPLSFEGIARLLSLKQRSWEQGLLLVAANIDQIAEYLDGITATQYAQLDAAWPGPVTYLVPDNGLAPSWIVGEHKTLGLRVSAHPMVKEICELVGPIVSTSANLSGRPAAVDVTQVRRYFGKELDLVLPGALGNSIGPSEIRNLATGEIVR